MALNKPRLYQIKISLRGSQPPIWRRVTLGTETTLGQLHRIIQAAMGWQQAHMHIFQADNGALYGPPEEDDGSLPMKDEHSVTLGKVLRKPKKTLRYEYDFGDGWVHEILLEKSLPMIGEAPQPVCTTAAGACPPEDVGGPGGYAHMLTAIQDPSHPEHQDMVKWLGSTAFDPDFVDLDEINARLINMNEPDTEDSILKGVMDEVRDTLMSEGVESEEEAREVVKKMMEVQAATPISDFHGLDPDRMHALLYQTFDSPWLTWSDSVEAPASPVMQMLIPLLNRLKDRDIKTTAKGNLPVAVVKDMLDMLSESNKAEIMAQVWRERIRSEDDVMAVNVTRLVAQLAGIIHHRGNHLVLKASWRKVLASSNWGKVYMAMFKAMMTEFNWAYVDGLDEAPSIQTTSPFTLWLLHRYGDQWRPATFYEDAQLQAFPMLVDEIEPKRFSEPVEEVRSLLRLRTFSLFYWFGLVEQRPLPEGPTDRISMRYETKVTPVLEELVQWG